MNLHPCDPQAAFLAARPAGSFPPKHSNTKSAGA
jgi:hypothetical protein